MSQRTSLLVRSCPEGVPSDGTTFLASERLSGMTTESFDDESKPPGSPLLDGIHHLKLPVTDLDRSLAWYQDHLGYG